MVNAVFPILEIQHVVDVRDSDKSLRKKNQFNTVQPNIL